MILRIRWFLKILISFEIREYFFVFLICTPNNNQFQLYFGTRVDPCSGPTCEIKEESDFGTECENNSDCSSEGQYCDPTSKQCKCNQGLGYILDEFQPSLTYGECVGPVPECDTSQDCEFGQSCLFGFCACLEGQKQINSPFKRELFVI